MKLGGIAKVRLILIELDPGRDGDACGQGEKPQQQQTHATIERAPSYEPPQFQHHECAEHAEREVKQQGVEPAAKLKQRVVHGYASISGRTLPNTSVSR